MFVAQTVRCDFIKKDIIFLLDSSGSIRDTNPADGSYDNWALMLNFVRNLVDQLNIGENETHVAVVSFSQTARTIFHLDTYYDKTLLKNAITNIPYVGGLTGIAAAFRLALDEFAVGDRPDAPNVAILITDGSSNVDLQRTFPDAQSAKNAGIQVFCVGITSDISVPTVQKISSLPQQQNVNYWLVPNELALNSFVSPIMTEICRPVTPSKLPSC